MNIVIDTPIRIRGVIVEKYEVAKRWEEEVSLVMQEMANFIGWYMDVKILQLTKIAEDLQATINSSL